MEIHRLIKQHHNTEFINTENTSQLINNSIHTKRVTIMIFHIQNTRFGNV